MRTEAARRARDEDGLESVSIRIPIAVPVPVVPRKRHGRITS